MEGLRNLSALTSQFVRSQRLGAAGAGPDYQGTTPTAHICISTHLHKVICLDITTQIVYSNMDVQFKKKRSLEIVPCLLIYHSNSPYLLKVIRSVILSVRSAATSWPHLNGTSEVSIRSDEHLEER